jgi:signal transduction histidine kinase
MNLFGYVLALIFLATSIILYTKIRGLKRLRQTWVRESARLAKLQENLMQNMSHELRTPITAMRGNTDLLLELARKDHLDQRYLEALETIAKNQNFLLDLLNSILSYAKSGSDVNFEDNPPQEILLKSFFSEILDLFKPQAEKRGLKLEFKIDAACPERVSVRSGAFRLIVINLLQNALKFTHHGRIEVLVSHQDFPQLGRGELTTTVRDTGIGIDPKLLREIFQPFFQADSSASREFGGVGLGLSISQNLSRYLGGGLTVESTLNKGTSFHLVIPVEKAETVLPSSPLREEKSNPCPDMSHKRVLLVEDSPDSMIVLKFFLEKCNTEVVTAQNGREAVDIVREAILKQNPIDIILMDMQMPVMNGFQATRLLRQRGYDKPIIAITAHNLIGDREKCLDAGCSDYIAKPVSSAIFYSKLRALEV